MQASNEWKHSHNRNCRWEPELGWACSYPLVERYVFALETKVRRAEGLAVALTDAMAMLPQADRWERVGIEKLEQRLRLLGADVFDPNYKVRAWLRWKSLLAAYRSEKGEGK